jgi:hypothetical protein
MFLAKILADFEINNIAGAPPSALSHNSDRVQASVPTIPRNHIHDHGFWKMPP